MGRVFRVRRGRRRLPPEFRLMTTAGLLLGLVAWQALDRWQAPLAPAASAAPSAADAAGAPDPRAEARRSRQILEGQEATPARPAAPAAGSRDGRQRVAAAAAVRVIDGDTIDVDGVRIRILGIDTPETHPARCPYEAELGARATRRLDAWLAEGEFELVADGRDEDRYGRKLRRVVRGQVSVGDVLVAEGLARPYGTGRRPWCA